jgi:hypothetical protein
LHAVAIPVENDSRTAPAITAIFNSETATCLRTRSPQREAVRANPAHRASSPQARAARPRMSEEEFYCFRVVKLSERIKAHSLES